MPRGFAELLERRHLEPVVRGRDRVPGNLGFLGILGFLGLVRLLGGLVLLERLFLLGRVSLVVVGLELDRLQIQFRVRIVVLDLVGLGRVLFVSGLFPVPVLVLLRRLLGLARGGFEGKRVDPGGLEHVVELKLARRQDVVVFVVVVAFAGSGSGSGSGSLGASSIVLLAHESEHEVCGVVVDVVVGGAGGFSAPELAQRAARLDPANAPRIFFVVVVERRGGLGAVAATAPGRAALALVSMGRAEGGEGRRGVASGLGRNAAEVGESDRRASVGGGEHAPHHERAAEGEAHQNTAPDAPRMALARAEVGRDSLEKRGERRSGQSRGGRRDLAGARNSKRTPTDGMFRRAGGGCGAGRNARAHHLRVVAVERRVRSGLIPGLGCGPRRVRHLARLVRRASACNLFPTRAGDDAPNDLPGRQQRAPGGYDLMTTGGPVRGEKKKGNALWSADQKPPEVSRTFR